MNKVAIITAMQSEYDAILTEITNASSIKDTTTGQINNVDVVLILSGVGKVAGALATQETYMKNSGIDLIINSGVAGSISENLKIYDVVMATEVGYHDVNVTHFGYSLGQLPGQEKMFRLKTIEDEYTVKGLVLSGDQFIDQESARKIKENFPNAISIEMEAGGIAQAANKLGVECMVIRAISDNALKPGNNIDFKTFEIEAAKKTAQVIKRIIRR